VLTPPPLPHPRVKTSTARLVAAGSSPGLLRPRSSLLLYKAAAPWDGGVVRVYSSDDFPATWRLRVFLLYKAAPPLHFTPSKVTPLDRPLLGR